MRPKADEVGAAREREAVAIRWRLSPHLVIVKEDVVAGGWRPQERLSADSRVQC